MAFLTARLRFGRVFVSAYLGVFLSGGFGGFGCRSNTQSEASGAILSEGSSTAPQAATVPTEQGRTAERIADSAPLVDLAFTTGGAPPDARLPWIVALHGLGDRPEAFSRLLRELPFQVHVHVPRAPLDYGDGYDWFGVRVGSGDQQRLSEAILGAAERVVRLIDELAKDPRHIGKPIVTGFSQGGMLCFALAVHHPERIAASLPLAGWLPPPLWPSDPLPQRPSSERAGGEGSTLGPILAFHGSEDQTVPLGPTYQAILHLIALGYDAQLEVHPNLGHTLDPALLQAWRAALDEQRAALAAPERSRP